MFKKFGFVFLSRVSLWTVFILFMLLALALVGIPNFITRNAKAIRQVPYSLEQFEYQPVRFLPLENRFRYRYDFITSDLQSQTDAIQSMDKIVAGSPRVKWLGPRLVGSHYFEQFSVEHSPEKEASILLVGEDNWLRKMEEGELKNIIEVDSQRIHERPLAFADFLQAGKMPKLPVKVKPEERKKVNGLSIKTTSSKECGDLFFLYCQHVSLFIAPISRSTDAAKNAVLYEFVVDPTIQYFPSHSGSFNRSGRLTRKQGSEVSSSSHMSASSSSVNKSSTEPQTINGNSVSSPAPTSTSSPTSSSSQSSSESSESSSSKSSACSEIHRGYPTYIQSSVVKCECNPIPPSQVPTLSEPCQEELGSRQPFCPGCGADGKDFDVSTCKAFNGDGIEISVEPSGLSIPPAPPCVKCPRETVWYSYEPTVHIRTGVYFIQVVEVRECGDIIIRRGQSEIATFDRDDLKIRRGQSEIATLESFRTELNRQGLPLSDARNPRRVGNKN